MGNPIIKLRCICGYDIPTLQKSDGEYYCPRCKGRARLVESTTGTIVDFSTLVMPHPLVAKIVAEDLDFQRAMLSLASCTPCDLDSLTEAFKKFAATRPEPWRDTVIYCREYFLKRGTFPFEIEDWPEFIEG